MGSGTCTGTTWRRRAAKDGDEYKPSERGLIISRSGYPGIQRFSVIWHGDNHAWWEHLRMAIDKALAYSLCGASYSGPDVP